MCLVVNPSKQENQFVQHTIWRKEKERLTSHILPFKLYGPPDKEPWLKVQIPKSRV